MVSPPADQLFTRPWGSATNTCHPPVRGDLSPGAGGSSAHHGAEVRKPGVLLNVAARRVMLASWIEGSLITSRLGTRPTPTTDGSCLDDA